MELLVFAIIGFMSLLCKEMSPVAGDIGTAAAYDAPYTATECNGQYPPGNMFAAVNEGLWEGGAACGRRYRLSCLSGVNKPCKEGAIDVVVVDFCPRSLCPSTLVMPKEAFAAISRFSNAKINIEFIE
ncbi:hypothetical protein L1049_013924 [Liquidambar formosana]|uniref:Expansin-like EG45 domain-containing protein n=1 Tax=Liquidambar formosana TaxID=63359 RepID=A0AAP0WUS1_LIQFO